MSTLQGDAKGINGPKLEPLRLGLGELIDGYGWQAHVIARRLFLELVSLLVPQVVDDLQDEPLRCLRQIDAELTRLKGLTDAEFKTHSDRLYEPLYALLRAWRLRHRLGTNEFAWGDGDALHTLRLWREQERNGEALTARLVSCVPPPSFVPSPHASGSFEFEWTTSILPAGRIITFPPTIWNPRVETRREGIERILGEVKEHLEAQMDEILEHRQVRGDKPVPKKKGGVRHFVWLVRYQIQGATFADLARESGSKVPSVMEAVTDTAALLYLPLRKPDRGGRPRHPRPPARTVVVKRYPSSM